MFLASTVRDLLSVTPAVGRPRNFGITTDESLKFEGFTGAGRGGFSEETIQSFVVQSLPVADLEEIILAFTG